MPDSDVTVGIVGLGALGSRMAERLAGTAAIRGIDRDVLEPENLATSPLYTEEQVERGVPKAVAAEEQLSIEGHVADLRGTNADTLLGGTDLILDGADTVATRRIINAWAVKHGVPWVHTAALASTGTVMPIIPQKTACYTCVFGHVDGTMLDTCTTAGLNPVVADRVADHAVRIAERILNGRPPPEELTRISADGARTVNVDKQSMCRVCQERRFDALKRDGVRTTRICGDGTYHIIPPLQREFEPDEIAETIGERSKVDVNEHLLRFEGNAGRITVFRDGRAVIEAESKEAARRRYAQIVGV